MNFYFKKKKFTLKKLGKKSKVRKKKHYYKKV